MTRTEILLILREKVLTKLAENKDNRAKWLTELMDIDDEMEEMKEGTEKHQQLVNIFTVKEEIITIYFTLLDSYLPPLKERTENILAFANKFLEELNRKYALKQRFSTQATQAVLNHS